MLRNERVEAVMTGSRNVQALALERCCALVASALSEGRRSGVRLVSGERRCFGMNTARTIVNVPYPGLGPDWTLRALTCGIAPDRPGTGGRQKSA